MRRSFSSVLPESRDAPAGQAVALRQVTRVYRSGGGAVTALDRVTLGFEAGTFTAVMGPSGSGKSTLLQCAAGLDRPTSGEVWLAGQELSRLGETGLTVLRRNRLAGRRPSRPEIRRVLGSVGLADRAGHRPSQLSGGQQQRVAIARALVTRPEVVFADEPTGMLDSASGREVLSLLRGLVDGQGQTVIMVTHDPVSASHASRVVFLADGRVAGELHGPTPQSVAARMTDLGAWSTGS
jgi:putative ABC transport system ATP-binding protein